MKTKNIFALLLTGVAGFVFFTVAGLELSGSPSYQDNTYHTESRSLNGSGVGVVIVLTIIFALVFYAVTSVVLNLFLNDNSASAGQEKLNENGVLPSSAMSAHDKALLAQDDTAKSNQSTSPRSVSVIVLSLIAACLNVIVCFILFFLIALGSSAVDKSDPRYTRIQYFLLSFIITSLLSILVSIVVIIGLLRDKKGQLKISMIATLAQSLLPAIFNPIFGIFIFILLLIPLALYRKAYRIDNHKRVPNS